MRSFANQSKQTPANGTIGWCPHAGTNRDKLPTPSGQGYSAVWWKLNLTGKFNERKQYLSYTRLQYQQKIPWWGSSFKGREKVES
jgi:hypothetical protein